MLVINVSSPISDLSHLSTNEGRNALGDALGLSTGGGGDASKDTLGPSIGTWP